MEWVECLRKAIDYIEAHLLEECRAEDIGESVNMSSFYFQKGFKIITGYSVGEYVRNRRLYLAALEVIKGEEKIIDLAYKYGYDTPESFTKAFSRFHGLSPMQLKNEPQRMYVFLPLHISLSIKGGSQMDYRVEKMEAFKVIGMGRNFSYDSAFGQIPGFWDKYCKQYMNKYCKCMPNYSIGKYGICIEEGEDCKAFRYLIAGNYEGGGSAGRIGSCRNTGTYMGKVQMCGTYA